MANPLDIYRGDSDRPIPPKGDSPEQKEARVNFWIARGNALLEEAGKHHLHWCHANGNYWIEPRPVAGFISKYVP